MRLRLETTERDPFWIVGNPALRERDEMSEAQSETFQVSRNMQGTAGAEWDAQEFFDRKNQRVTFDATTRYEFLTEWERMDFIARLAAIDEANQEHLWQGDVWLRLDKAGTSEFREWKLPRSVIGLAGSDLEGACGLRLRYRVTVGGFGTEAREGISSLVRLIATEPATFGVVIPAAEIQALTDAYPSAEDFVLNVELEYSGGAYLSVNKYLVPTGTGTGDPEFELPLSGSLDDLAAALDDDLAYPDVTNAAGALSIISPSSTALAYLNVTLSERHYDPYAVLITTPLATWSGAVIPGTDYLLIGTDGTDHVLIGLDDGVV